MHQEVPLFISLHVYLFSPRFCRLNATLNVLDLLLKVCESSVAPARSGTPVNGENHSFSASTDGRERAGGAGGGGRGRGKRGGEGGGE